MEWWERTIRLGKAAHHQGKAVVEQCPVTVLGKEVLEENWLRMLVK
jgi:hypothetical protein